MAMSFKFNFGFISPPEQAGSERVGASENEATQPVAAAPMGIQEVFQVEQVSFSRPSSMFPKVQTCAATNKL